MPCTICWLITLFGVPSPTLMKYPLTIVIVLGLALTVIGHASDSRLGVQSKGEHEYMFVGGDGQKAWYSALELERIAKAYAKSKKLAFEFEGTEKNIWVNTDGGKVLAEVWFSSGVGRPALQIQIGRKGDVLKHKIVEVMGG
jgi:hypothetical protein